MRNSGTAEMREEDGKLYVQRHVPRHEIEAIVRRNARIAETQSGDNQAAGSWHPLHVDEAFIKSGVGHMPRNDEQRARVVAWLIKTYPYGVINQSNLFGGK